MRLIDAKRLEANIKEAFLENPVVMGIMLRWIRKQPTADVAPVVHGRWVTHYRSGTTVSAGYVSTCCDMWNNRKSNYCPNCGARMDGDECR